MEGRMKLLYASLIFVTSVATGFHIYSHESSDWHRKQIEKLLALERNIAELTTQIVLIRSASFSYKTSYTKSLEDFSYGVGEYLLDASDSIFYDEVLQYKQVSSSLQALSEDFAGYLSLIDELTHATLQIHNLNRQYLKKNYELSIHAAEIAGLMLVYQFEHQMTTKRDIDKKITVLKGIADEPKFKSWQRSLQVFLGYARFISDNVSLADRFLKRLVANKSFEYLTDMITHHENEIYRNQHREVLTFMVFFLAIFISIVTIIYAKNKGLKKQTELAQRATQAKSDFLANMSHEIRTPMNAIVGFMDLALPLAINTKQRDFLERIKTASDALLVLINDILDFSKIEAGKLEIEHTNFDLNERLDLLCSMFADVSLTKDVEMVVHNATHLNKWLRGDPLRLSQILINLTSNAVKFTEKGQILVLVKSLRFEGENSQTAWLQFEVRDTGIGISEDHQPFLFEAFNQGDNSTTRNYGGTGLGLTICKQLTELMGGEIKVESQLGKGSTFIVRLPFELVKPPCDTAFYHMVGLVKGCRALIVDDDPHFAEAVVDMLQYFGVHSEYCSSGQEALDKLIHTHTSIDVLLVDWWMPEMNGLDFVNVLKQALPELKKPVIMMSAHEQIKVMGKKLQGLTCSYLPKPFSSLALLKAFIQALRLDHLLELPRRDQDNYDGLYGKRILLVEDNKVNQLLASKLLRNVGMVTDIANNGEEAVSKVKQQLYDAVLMDVHMPIMDGYQATELIRESFSEEALPIIAMTANVMKGDKEKCLAMGMNDYLTKPIQKEILYKSLSKWMSSTRQILNERALSVANVTSLRVRTEEANDTPYAGDHTVRSNSSGESSVVAFQSSPKLLNIKEAMGRLDQDYSLYSSMLELFLKDFSNTPRQLQSMVEDANYDEIVELVHSIKGVAANISAQQLYFLAEKIEQKLVQENKEVDDLLNDFQHCHQRTIEAIQTYMTSVLHV